MFDDISESTLATIAGLLVAVVGFKMTVAPSMKTSEVAPASISRAV